MAKIHCIFAGRDGRSRFAGDELQLRPESSGRLSTGFLEASAWMYGVAETDRAVDWHTAGPGGISVMLEGCMEVEAGDGERRTIGVGDMLIALDTSGQGHRTRVTEGSRGLTVALRGDPHAVMKSLFGRVLDDQ